MIDGATNSVTTLNACLARTITLNPVTNKVYVGCANTGAIDVIDGGTNTISTINVQPYTPSDLVENPVTNMLFATTNGSLLLAMILNTSEAFEFYNQASIHQRPRGKATKSSYGWPATVFLPVLWPSKRRSPARAGLSKVLLLLVCGAVAIALQGCGDKLPTKTPPGTYTVTVVATDTSSVSHMLAISN